jgi:hypothetical protein
VSSLSFRNQIHHIGIHVFESFESKVLVRKPSVIIALVRDRGVRSFVRSFVHLSAFFRSVALEGDHGVRCHTHIGCCGHELLVLAGEATHLRTGSEHRIEVHLQKRI